MAYSDFTLPDVLRSFGLTREDRDGLFGEIATVLPSPILAAHLEESAEYALRLNTEKARSELLIMPILMEVRRRANYRVSVFSGTSFNVDAELRLAGFCDYLVSASPESLYVEAPVLAVVEAKNEAIVSGYGQCIAEMVAAQLFNERNGAPRERIYGAVTTGDAWSFLMLTDQTVLMESSYYYLDQLEKILGILLNIVGADSVV